MERMEIVGLTSENAQLLADYVAIEQDLSFCMGCCNRLTEILKSGKQDLILQRALWTSALVAYARCFATGVRYGLTPAIFDTMEPEVREAHAIYMGMRNKHTAHSVNPFEQITVGAILSPPGSPTAPVEGIQTMGATQVNGSPQDLTNVRLLATAVLEFVNRAGRELSKKVTQEAKAMSPEELRKSANPRIVIPPHDAANRRR